MSRAGGFISFSDVSGSSLASSSSSSYGGGDRSRGAATWTNVSSITSPVYTGSNATLQQLSKKLLKKDTITRRKGLQEIQDIFSALTTIDEEDHESLSTVIDFIPHFCYVYERLWQDTDRGIRELLQMLLLIIIRCVAESSDKQALGPFMKVLIGPWRVACADPCSEVSMAAKNAWKSAIPGVKKRQKVMYFLFPCYIRFVQRILESPTLDTLPEPPGASAMTSEETQERLDRVNISAVGSLELFFVAPTTTSSPTTNSNSNSSSRNGKEKEDCISDTDLLQLTYKGIEVVQALAGPNLEVHSQVYLKDMLNSTVLWSKLSVQSVLVTPLLKLLASMCVKLKELSATATIEHSTSAFLESCNIDMPKLFTTLMKVTRHMVEKQRLRNLSILALSTLVTVANTCTNTDSTCWSYFPLLHSSEGTGKQKKCFLDVLEFWLLDSSTCDIALEYLLPIVACLPLEEISVQGQGKRHGHTTTTSPMEDKWGAGNRLIEIFEKCIAAPHLMHHPRCAISVAEASIYMLLKRPASTSTSISTSSSAATVSVVKLSLSSPSSSPSPCPTPSPSQLTSFVDTEDSVSAHEGDRIERAMRCLECLIQSIEIALLSSKLLHTIAMDDASLAGGNFQSLQASLEKILCTLHKTSFPVANGSSSIHVTGINTSKQWVDLLWDKLGMRVQKTLLPISAGAGADAVGTAKPMSAPLLAHVIEVLRRCHVAVLASEAPTQCSSSSSSSSSSTSSSSNREWGVFMIAHSMRAGALQYLSTYENMSYHSSTVDVMAYYQQRQACMACIRLLCAMHLENMYCNSTDKYQTFMVVSRIGNQNKSIWRTILLQTKENLNGSDSNNSSVEGNADLSTPLTLLNSIFIMLVSIASDLSKRGQINADSNGNDNVDLDTIMRAIFSACIMHGTVTEICMALQCGICCDWIPYTGTDTQTYMGISEHAHVALVKILECIYSPSDANKIIMHTTQAVPLICAPHMRVIFPVVCIVAAVEVMLLSNPHLTIHLNLDLNSSADAGDSVNDRNRKLLRIATLGEKALQYVCSTNDSAVYLSALFTCLKTRKITDMLEHISENRVKEKDKAGAKESYMLNFLYDCRTLFYDQPHSSSSLSEPTVSTISPSRLQYIFSSDIARYLWCHCDNDASLKEQGEDRHSRAVTDGFASYTAAIRCSFDYTTYQSAAAQQCQKCMYSMVPRIFLAFKDMQEMRVSKKAMLKLINICVQQCGYFSTIPSSSSSLSSLSPSSLDRGITMQQAVQKISFLVKFCERAGIGTNTGTSTGTGMGTGVGTSVIDSMMKWFFGSSKLQLQLHAHHLLFLASLVQTDIRWLEPFIGKGRDILHFLRILHSTNINTITSGSKTDSTSLINELRETTLRALCNNASAKEAVWTYCRESFLCIPSSSSTSTSTSSLDSEEKFECEGEEFIKAMQDVLYCMSNPSVASDSASATNASAKISKIIHANVSATPIPISTASKLSLSNPMQSHVQVKRRSLSLDTPLQTDQHLKEGTHVGYITQQHLSESTSATLLRVVPAVLQKVHLLDGSPYYTLILGEANEREVQTEAHRVLLNCPEYLIHNDSVSDRDVNDNVNVYGTVDRYGCPESGSSVRHTEESGSSAGAGDESFVLLSQWLLETCASLMELSHKSTSSSSTRVLMSHLLYMSVHGSFVGSNVSETSTGIGTGVHSLTLLDFICNALLCIGSVCDQELASTHTTPITSSANLGARSEHANEVFGAYRHLIVDLLSPPSSSSLSKLAMGEDLYAHSCADIKNRVASRLLHALSETNCGLGMGLWLPRVLHACNKQVEAASSSASTSKSSSSALWQKIKEKVTIARKYTYAKSTSTSISNNNNSSTDINGDKEEDKDKEKRCVFSCLELQLQWIESIGSVYCSLLACTAAGTGRCHDMFLPSASGSASGSGSRALKKVNSSSSPRTSSHDNSSNSSTSTTASVSPIAEASTVAEGLVLIQPWRALLHSVKDVFLIPVLGGGEASASSSLSAAAAMSTNEETLPRQAGSNLQDVLMSPVICYLLCRCLRLYWAANIHKQPYSSTGTGIGAGTGASASNQLRGVRVGEEVVTQNWEMQAFRLCIALLTRNYFFALVGSTATATAIQQCHDVRKWETFSPYLHAVYWTQERLLYSLSSTTSAPNKVLVSDIIREDAAMALHYGLLHGTVARTQRVFLKDVLAGALSSLDTGSSTAASAPAYAAAQGLTNVAFAGALCQSIPSNTTYASTALRGSQREIHEEYSAICPSSAISSTSTSVGVANAMHILCWTEYTYTVGGVAGNFYSIIAAKILDVWYSLGGDYTTTLAGELDKHLENYTGGHTSHNIDNEDDDEVDDVKFWTEEEKADRQLAKDAEEIRKDRLLFETVVGEDITARLAALLDQLGRNRQTILTTVGKPAAGSITSAYQSLHSMVIIFALVLQRVDQAALRRQEGNGFIIRARCGAYLREAGILSQIANFLLSISEEEIEAVGASGLSGSFTDIKKSQKVEHGLQRCMPMESLSVAVSQAESSQASQNTYAGTDKDADTPVFGISASAERTLIQLALQCFFRMAVVLPAVTRTWFQNDLNRQQKMIFGKFIETIVRPASMDRELQLIRDAQSAGKWNTDELEVHGDRTSGVTACFIRDDAKVEIKIRVPAQYPLKNVEVECVTKLCVPEAKWRRWSFQIIQLLGTQDGTIIEGVLLWKKNLENEFDGVEPCPICYSTLHYKSMSLPAMTCPTCSNKFHALCLNTWFKQSGKYKCVVCQQPFFQG